MTSKYGFSVVAPISVITPSSTAGQQRVLLRLVEAVDLVEEEDRPLSVRAEPLAGARDHLAHLRDRRRHGRELLERRAGRVGDDAGERRLAAARRAVEDHRADAVLLDREPERRARAEDVLLADELVEVFGRSRVASGATCGMRSRAASEKRSLTARSMLRPGSVTEVEDFSEPILPGTAASDYERYLRTDELLALQKRPEELSHRDELLFMTVHQSSELWLKLAAFEVETAVGLLKATASSAGRFACSAARTTA